VLYTDLKVATHDGGCVVSAFDTSTNSWETWMSITTAMLCDGIESASTNEAESAKVKSSNQ
jgi:hypothetical protein